MTENITPLREPTPPLRTPPMNIDVEQRLLGALLCDNRLLDFAEIVRSEHFGNALHGRIFETLQKLIDRDEIANPITLKRIFDQDAVLAEAGGARYLAQLAGAGAPVAARFEVEQYARIVSECWQRRELAAMSDEAAAAAHREDLADPPALQIERLEEQLYRLAENGDADAGLRPLSDAVGKALEIAAARYKRGSRLAGVPTGFDDLDKLLGGLHPSDLVILAGRPSMGKTALATNITINSAKNGETVAFFSLEMSEEQLGARVLAGASGLSADWLRRGDLGRVQFDKMVEACRQVGGLDILVDDTPGLTVAAMRRRARRHKRRHGLDLIVVDYLQLVQPPRPPGRSEQNRVQEVSEITRGLKALAKELEVPVLALSQLSRAVEAREDKRPLLSDLREFGLDRAGRRRRDVPLSRGILPARAGSGRCGQMDDVARRVERGAQQGRVDRRQAPHGADRHRAFAFRSRHDAISRSRPGVRLMRPPPAPPKKPRGFTSEFWRDPERLALFERFYAEGLSYGEIARRLGASKNMISGRVWRDGKRRRRAKLGHVA